MTDPEAENDQNLVCTHDFVLWNGNVECHNCDQIWVYQPTIESLTAKVKEAELRAEELEAGSDIIIDGLTAKLREAEDRGDAGWTEVAALRDEVERLTWHLEHAMKHSTECDCDVDAGGSFTVRWVGTPEGTNE